MTNLRSKGLEIEGHEIRSSEVLKKKMLNILSPLLKFLIILKYIQAPPYRAIEKLALFFKIMRNKSDENQKKALFESFEIASGVISLRFPLTKIGPNSHWKQYRWPGIAPFSWI